MTNGWPRKKVREIATHSLGKMLDKAKNKGELRPYLRNLNVRWFGFDLSDMLEMRFLPEETPKFTAFKGDVLICEGGHPGRAAIWESDEPVYFQKALHRVRFHEPERSKWFLYYLLSKDLDGTLKSHFNGAGIQHFTGEALAEFEVPLPPLPDQRRIVGILDEAFAGIATAKANTERNLENARALFESHLRSVFTQRGEGWDSDQLDTLTEPDSPITYGVVKPGDEGEIRFIRGGDLVRGEVRQNQLRTITRAVSDQYRRTLLRGGELLICLVGQPGQVAVAPKEMAGANIARQVGLIRLKKKMNAEFVRYFLQSAPGKEALGARESGSVQQVINLGELRHLSVPYPELVEQNEIVAKLDDFEAETQRLESLYHRKLVALDELKQSLLHQAFTGELTAMKPASVVVPTTISGISTTDLHAGILAMACDLHLHKGKDFGHVKAEKIVHMVEARLGIDLGRAPYKDASGPNDFGRLRKVEHRARKAGFFDFQQTNAGPYRVKKLGGFDSLIAKTRAALGERLGEVEHLLQWMLPRTVHQAEIIATVYAGWNNLLLDGKQPTDEEIVHESRENWHPKKLEIERQKFSKAVSWLRDQGVVPEGKGKRVSAKGTQKDESKTS